MLQQDPDEKIVLIVRRTLFGILPYFAFALAVFIGYIFFLYQIGLNPGRYSHFGVPMLVISATGVLVLVYTIVYLVINIYRNNTLTLTTESIVQRLQLTPFANKVSQLALDDIEDVSVAQPGFLASLFNYGTITVETAGEQQNFVFPLASNPSYVSNKIITTKEAFEARKRQARSESTDQGGQTAGPEVRATMPPANTATAPVITDLPTPPTEPPNTPTIPPAA